MAMARKTRATATKEAPAARKGARLSPVVSIKGSPQWGAWFTGLAAKVRSTKAGTIDRALAELAARVGYEEPPAR
jgi:hypothetical protein